ncbi:DUF6542 domain-containing protein [Nocardioides sp. GY 10127]|uniref:DUF6542 domain-containing protein n=1 Tax=Nocardioides sp. GY 10127 TaxID=2569762 RepID=UPI0010A8B05E|nr:DUF6542 domain-containing protein [Nocardioides sp. GY 10127]TIC81720.1 hypothetical protein E8D37_11040 [Nocardioides sp. GY 10127]
MTARTVWEEGRYPGWLVAGAATAATLGALAIDAGFTSGLGLLFDSVYVLSCVGIALMVRPSDSFVAGIVPPWLMTGLLLVAAWTDPGIVTTADDGLVQAVASGLGLHAFPLVLGYGLAFGVLWMRDRVRKAHAHPKPQSSAHPSPRPAPVARSQAGTTRPGVRPVTVQRPAGRPAPVGYSNREASPAPRRVTSG